MIERRKFMKMVGGSALSGVALYNSVKAKSAQASSGQITYQGADLTDWNTVVGDGLYVAPGQAPISENDIETVNYGTHSELHANVLKRGIMAHNIAFSRVIDDQAFNYTHLCEYQFRLPYLPQTNNWDLNAQTLEASIFIWDGGDTRLDYGMAFQWILNPWMSSFGDIWCWTGTNGGQWAPSGYLAPDTEWHTVSMVYDHQLQATSLLIDGNAFACAYSAIPKAASWGTETAARLSAEIISIYPGEQSTGPMHTAEFRNWSWTWIPESN